MTIVNTTRMCMMMCMGMKMSPISCACLPDSRSKRERLGVC